MFTAKAQVTVDGVRLQLSPSASSGIEAIRDAMRRASQADEILATLGDGTIILRRYNKDATSDFYYQQDGQTFGPFRVIYSNGHCVQATVGKVTSDKKKPR